MQESNAPIIQSFRMLGIHGYKDISMVIAENGARKTTILSALYAFLKGDFERFRRLSFDSIECRFSGQSTPLVLRRNAIAQQGESSHEPEYAAESHPS